MKLKPSKSSIQPRLIPWLLPAALACGLAAFVPGARAQQALAPSPELSVTPPALRAAQQNEMEVFAPPDVVQIPETPPFKMGPVTLRPHAFYRFLNGDSIPAQSNHVSSTVQDISPGVLVGIGEHWTIDYTPTWRFYSSKAFNDTLDHYARLTGGASYEDWLFTLSQSYLHSSPPLVQTGTQTKQDTYVTTLGASDQLNSKMSMELGAVQNIVSTEAFTSYKEWSTLDWLDYEFYPRLNAGGGVGLGYVDVNVGNDMVYEQFQGRVGWRATDKIGLQIRGGAEVRQFLSGGGTLINPLVSGVLQYQPVEVTRLSLRVDHTVAASYFQNQATETTEIIGGVNQRFLKVLFLDLSGGYHHIKYVASTGDSAGRSDDYYTFDARMSTTFLKQRGTAAVFYEYSDNSSTSSDPTFTYTSNQVGFELGYRY